MSLNPEALTQRNPELKIETLQWVHLSKMIHLLKMDGSQNRGSPSGYTQNEMDETIELTLIEVKFENVKAFIFKLLIFNIRWARLEISISKSLQGIRTQIRNIKNQAS